MVDMIDRCRSQDRKGSSGSIILDSICIQSVPEFVKIVSNYEEPPPPPGTLQGLKAPLGHFEVIVGVSSPQ